MENKNTRMKTLSDLNIFQTFIKNSWGEIRNVEEIDFGRLDMYLAEFFCTAKRKNGEEYTVSSLTTFQGSIMRYLRSLGINVNLRTDPAFLASREALHCKKMKGGNDGTCQKKQDHNRPFTAKEIDVLYNKGLLGNGSPEAIINTLWLNMVHAFGSRGRDYWIKLRWGDLELMTDESGIQFLQLLESEVLESSSNMPGVSPVRVGGGLRMYSHPGDPRCPVLTFLVYKSHRPPSTLESDCKFFLQKIDNPQTTIWFRSQPIGKNPMGSIAQQMAKQAGFSGHYDQRGYRYRHRIKQKQWSHIKTEKDIHYKCADSSYTDDSESMQINEAVLEGEDHLGWAIKQDPDSADNLINIEPIAAESSDSGTVDYDFDLEDPDYSEHEDVNPQTKKKKVPTATLR